MKKMKRFLALIGAVCIAAAGFGLSSAPAQAADTEPAAIADSYTVGDVTYYKVDSGNFAKSAKTFYSDLLGAESSVIGGSSANADWLTIGKAVYSKKGQANSNIKQYVLNALSGSESMGGDSKSCMFYDELKAADSLKQAEENMLKEISSSAGRDISSKSAYPSVSKYLDYYSAFKNDTDPDTVLYTVGYTGNVMSAPFIDPMYVYSSAFMLVFSDFKVTPLLPLDEGSNYVYTTIQDVETNSGIQGNSVKNESAVEVKASQTLSGSVTGSVASEVNGSTSHTISNTVSIGTEHQFPLVGSNLSLSYEFSSSKEVTRGWTESKEHSETKDLSRSIEVTLPPYTGVLLKQTEKAQETLTEYNCPVAVSFRVRMVEYNYGMNDNRFTGSGSILADFTGNAQVSLKQRAINDRQHMDTDDILWTDFADDAAVQTAISHMASAAPMASTEATFTEKMATVESTVEGLMPLNPLKTVQLKDQNKTVGLIEGKSLRLDTIALEGLNGQGSPYFGFDSGKGKWIITDKAGKQLTDNTIAKIARNSSTGKVIVKGISPGTVYVRYLINEDQYGTWSAPEAFATNDSLTETAVIKLVVKPLFTAGQRYAVNGNTYKILSPDNLTVSFVKAKNTQSVTVPATVKIKGKTLKVIRVDAKAFTGSLIRTVTIGKYVKQLKGNAFAGSKATKIVLKTKLLKKATVTDSLKSSVVKTIVVRVGTTTQNKKYVTIYKKIFTKANAGRTVTVK